ncbi:MAG TPA: DUF2382 domain-containing protein [Roseomonas sp.]|nr:DUF2382 domain-containing protein [Roseomonas sp.]
MPAETEPTVVPVTEETIEVKKAERESGRVRVLVHTETVREMVEETLRSSSTAIERVAVGREVAEIPQIREEDGVLIIPVVEEVLIVERRLLLKEEIRLRQTELEKTIRQPVERRVQRAEIERLPPASGESSSASSSDVP